MPKSADPDGTARYEPSHLDLHCLQRYLYWSEGMKGLTGSKIYFGTSTNGQFSDNPKCSFTVYLTT